MEPLVTVSQVEKTFSVPVLTGFDLSLYPGERVALVGESGCGKTTMGRILAGLLRPDGGSLAWRSPRPTVQMVFQDAHSSFNPKLKLKVSLLEPMENQGVAKQVAQQRMADLLMQCGLESSVMERYPRQLSGGQCQRAALARALSIYPDILICDEVTSALDYDTSCQILGLMTKLQKAYGLTYLLITHDNHLANTFCTRIVTME